MLRKNDVILLVLVLIVGIAGIFLVNSFKMDGTGSEVVITIDGKVNDILPLNEDNIITVCDQNIITIASGTVCVSEANCADKVCVNMGKISSPGQSIVCLPHKLVITVRGKQEELDGKTY